MLEGNGIFAYVRDAEIVGMNWMYSNAIGGVKLEVNENDVAEAIELICKAKREEGFLKCDHCGSSNVKMREMSITTMIGWILFGIFAPFQSKKIDCIDCKKTSEKAARG